MNATGADAVPVVSKLDPVSVFSALGSEVRLAIVKMLAEGRRLSIGEIAAALGRDVDGVGKQMLVLYRAGLVEAMAGEDRRQTVYQMGAAFRATPGVLDFWVARVDLSRL